MNEHNNSEENTNTNEDLEELETEASVEETEGTEDESKETSAEETKEEKSETVSLSKYMKLKKKLKKETGTQISEEDLKLVKQLAKEKEQKEFEKAFDNDFDKVVKLYPEVKDKRDTVLALSLTDKFKENTLEEIVQNTFEGLISKVSTEDDAGVGEGDEVKTIDFANATEEQLEKVMKDPKARKKYISWKVEQA